MRCRFITGCVLLLGTLVYVCSFDRRLGLAQSPAEEKPTLKVFGSSLDRLKWDPAKQAAVETKTTEKSEGSDTEDVVRVETQLVVCDVQVLDKRGRAVPGLTQNDFLIAEDGVPQQISHFSLGNDAKVERSIVLIIDYSGSQLNYLHMSVEAAKRLVDQLGPKDRMAIVTDDVALLIDFSSDKAQLKQTLERLEQRALLFQQVGRSAQFSALLATVRELVSVEDIRPIIVFQTDGDEVSYLKPPDPNVVNPNFLVSPQDNERLRSFLSSKLTEFSLNDVYAATEKSRATVYTVIPGIKLMGLRTSDQLLVARSRENEVKLVFGDFTSLPPLSTEKLMSLIDFRVKQQSAAAGVATLTGGWTAFLEQPAQANEIYARILSDMNSRYVVGYYPSNKTHDGRRRKVLVQVRNHAEYSLEGRRSYFAPGPER